jgi:predicted GIY-YIG superfamily endonuclease
LATSSRGPWKLIYYEAYRNQADALGRERYLKSGSGRRL